MSEKAKLVYIRDDGIVYVDANDASSEEDVKYLMKELVAVLKLKPGKSKVLVNVGRYPIDAMRSSSARNFVAEEVKKATKDPGYEKAAIFGGNVIIKTIASFIITASGVSDIVKVFIGKKEAIEWLKK